MSVFSTVVRVSVVVAVFLETRRCKTVEVDNNRNNVVEMFYYGHNTHFVSKNKIKRKGTPIGTKVNKENTLVSIKVTYLRERKGQTKDQERETERER